MVAINHALTGGVVAVSVGNPTIALPAALFSHFIIDALPHWNYQIHSNKKLRPVAIGIDILLSTLGLAALSTVLDVEAWLFFLGGALAVLPDIMWLPYILSGKETLRHRQTPLHLLRRLHMRIQWSETNKGMLVELAWFAGMTTVILSNFR